MSEISEATVHESAGQALALPPTTVRPHTTILPRYQTDANGDIQFLHEPQERFAEVEVLGEGASGMVILAKDQDIQRSVALKKLKHAHEASESLIRFIKEVQITGTLDHPNITALHDVGLTADGSYFFVMKYQSGSTLRDLIDKLVQGDRETHEKFPFSVRINIFLKIAQAVQFAHSKGIIHRDLKPENIVVGDFGEVTVMDWGIAKVIRTQKGSVTGENEPSAHLENLPPECQDIDAFATQENTLIGTLAYMAPEQARGAIQELSEATDIYSLSAILYEWLTLHHYLERHTENNMTLWWGILNEKPPSPHFLADPSGLQGNPPAEYLHFVVKGLAKKPEDRFSSLSAMIGQLQSLQEGNIPIRCPITFSRRLGSQLQQTANQHMILTLVGLALLAAFSMIGFLQVIVWLL